MACKKNLEFVSNDPRATVNFGKYIARFLKANSIVALSGQLGCGKTTLIKGIAQGMGIDPRQVNSPSFVLIKEYQGRHFPLFHFDFYRLNRLAQVADLGIEEYFEKQGVVLIEWAKRGEKLLPEEHLCIDIFFVAKNKRRFKFFPHGRKYQALVEKIKISIEKVTF